MARDWETQFAVWARPPTVAETERWSGPSGKSVRQLTPAPSSRRTSLGVYSQGSYYNRTNVPRESDVDVRVVPDDVFFPDWELVDLRAPHTPEVREALNRQIGSAPFALYLRAVP